MPPVSPSEQAIAQLCAKVIAVQDCEGFEEAVQALRVALHEHLAALRDKVADLAFVVAAEDKKKRGAGRGAGSWTWTLCWSGAGAAMEGRCRGSEKGQ